MDKEYERKCFVLAHDIFPEVTETVEDLEIKYPDRNTKVGGFVTRYAPSPTGFIHTGALFVAMVAKKVARQTDGVFYLRIEDTDRKREVPGSVHLFTEELSAFGLFPDEGVIDEGKEKGYYGPYTQSERKEIYDICAKHLIEKGLAYPCFCTPDMLKSTHDAQEAGKVIPGYYGVYAKCRNVSIEESIERVKAGEKFILRFRSSGSHLKKTSFIDGVRGKIDIAENDQDIVLIKGDGLPTYHFAHVVDDHFMRTTHVIRGEEWISSTPVHIDLFHAMGFEAPNYVHTPLIMIKEGNSKRKLSKRKDKEAAVSFFLKTGYVTEAVIEYLLTLANSDYEMWRNKNKEASTEDFTFKFDKMSSAGSLLDMMKLNDISKEWIARMDSKQVLENVLAWAKVYDRETYTIIGKDPEYARAIFAVERDGAKKIRKDIIKWEDILPAFFYFFDELYEKDINENGYGFECLVSENAKVTKEMTKQVLDAYKNVYDETLEKEAWFEQIKESATALGFCTDMKEYKQNPDQFAGSTADFAGTIRMAITNRQNTPDIYQIMKLIGKEEVTKRLEAAILALS